MVSLSALGDDIDRKSISACFSGLQDAPYAASKPNVDAPEQMVRREEFEEFSAVGALRDRIWIVDSAWNEMLLGPCYRTTKPS